MLINAAGLRGIKTAAVENIESCAPVRAREHQFVLDLIYRIIRPIHVQNCFADAFARARAAIGCDSFPSLVRIMFEIIGMGASGQIVLKRMTLSSAIKKAKELIARECIDVQIVSPNGEIYRPKEFHLP